MTPQRPRTWFITGAGRGFGRGFTEAALAAGDRVAATARRPEVLAELAAAHKGRLVVLALDVDDRAAVFGAVEEAIAAFGQLDIVVNNAGYGLMGAIEEIDEAHARAQMDTNFFGALWVTQAVLPQLREQGSGHIVQISSSAVLAGFPTMGLYGASKWALECMSEALAKEVERFGIRVTLVEPAGYATEWGTTSMRFAPSTEPYDALRSELAEQYGDMVDDDPAKVVAAVLELVADDDPPVHLLLGKIVYDGAFEISEQRRAEWRRWEHLSLAA